MALDERGKACIAIIVFYAPFIPFSLYCLFKFRPLALKLGWFFLNSFAIGRVVGAVMLVDVETAKNPSQGVATGAFIIIAVALTPLLMACMSFLHAVADNKGVYPPLPFNNIASMHFLHLTASLAVILSALGATDSISHDTSKQNTGHTLRRVGGVIYIALFGIIASLHALYFAMRNRMVLRKRKLLLVLMASLPFLAVRVLYSILSAFSDINSASVANGPFQAPPSTGGLGKFNTITGSATVFVVMAILMEFIIVLIYCVFGFMVWRDWEGNELNLYGGGNSNVPVAMVAMDGQKADDYGGGPKY